MCSVAENTNMISPRFVFVNRPTGNGRAAPSHTRPRRGREPGASPQRGEAGRGGQRRMRVGEQPMFTLAVHAARAAPRRDEKRFFLGGRSPPRPSRGWGHGETRFPHPPRRGLMFTLGGVRPGNLRAGEAGTGGVGAGFPRPYAGLPPGRGCAPSPALPRRGREPGASPQRGEAGRGAERRARWSPQPPMRFAHNAR